MLRTYLQLPRAIHILCLGTFINRAGTLVVPFLTLYLREELKLSVSVATSAMGAFGVGTVAAMLAGGHLADRYGRKIVMASGLIGGAALILLLSTLRDPMAIIPVMALFAFVAEMYRPAASAMIGDLAPPERREQAFTLMYVSINLGFTFGPLIAAALAKHSFMWLFWGDALTTLLYAAILILTIAESHPMRAAAARKKDASDSAGDVPYAPVVATAMPSATRHILGNTPFMVFCLATYLQSLVYVQHISTAPLYMQSIGLGMKAFSRIIALNGAMIVLLQIPLTPFLQRLPRGGVLVAAGLLLSLGFGLTGVAATAWQMAATVAIWTLGEIIQAPQMSAIVADMAPEQMRGRYFGVFSVSFSSAMMIGAPLGGLVLEKLGGGALWSICAMVGLVSTTMYASIYKHVARRKPAPAVTNAPAVQSAVVDGAAAG